MAVITEQMLEQENEDMGHQNEALRFFRRKVADAYLPDNMTPVDGEAWSDIQDAILDKIDYWLSVNQGFQRMNERIIRRMQRMAREEI